MILTKPFISFVSLACLIPVVFAQTPSVTAVESNSTEIRSSSTSSIISNITQSASIIEPTSSPISSSTTIPPFVTTTSSSNANAVPTVQSTGFDSNGNNSSDNQQSWLKQNNRFVFVIVLGLLFLGVLIWYVVRSVKGMRKRLEADNQAQLYMMQQASSPPPQQRNDRVIPELTQTPPPAYKTEEHTPVQTPSNNY